MNMERTELSLQKKKTKYFHDHLLYRYSLTVNQTFEVMISNYPLGTIGSVVSLLAAALYQGNHHMSHKLWNSGSSERYTNEKKKLCIIKN